MFPHDYFAAGAFASDYFPPVASIVVPPVPHIGGGRYRDMPVPDERPPIDLDEELMFWIL